MTTTTTATTLTRQPTRARQATAIAFIALVAALGIGATTQTTANRDMTTTDRFEHANSDPFQVMADITPVVSSHLPLNAAATVDPLQAMADPTPVVAALHHDPRGGHVFDQMRDLTPVIATHRTTSTP